ncbi:be127fd3-bebb-4008-95b3-4be681597008 [Sclerotinia trifoliorum]|uniref:Be127fd3-bebb-4008-95b3-4be681597008 n=1 Tax=Sclerotinia trifoliorum TaxID=28548 RepID=A0A8H2VV92_9HELO|nr:be127fd3-bebb-4008-95b3-4be681597008 [Sclerotinia trifoliorum]
MPSPKENYQPLQEMSEGDEDYIPSLKPPKKRLFNLVTIALITSLFLNVLFGLRLFSSFLTKKEKDVSKFAGLARDLIVVNHGHTEYSDINDTAADYHWDRLDTESGLITLTDDYARSKGLVLGARYPWNHERGVYWLQSSHNLHCLKLIRRSIVDFRHDRPQALTREHINHCLDALRQKTMCDASDQPLSTIEGHYSDTGHGLVMQCRSWDKLLTWSKDVKRESCFRWIDEYRTPEWLYERFGFCPENSVDYPAKEQYFQIHGHHDPWGFDS